MEGGSREGKCVYEGKMGKGMNGGSEKYLGRGKGKGKNNPLMEGRSRERKSERRKKEKKIREEVNE